MGNPDVTLITGATGFVGAAVARNLAKRGHRLRLSVRAGSDRRNLAGIPAELVEADLGNPESLARAVSGCRYVFHVAADYRLWVPNPEEMRRINVTGTLDLMAAAWAAGVERVVYTSSVAALGLKPDGAAADETTPVDPALLVGAYKRSKYEAERAVRRLAAGGQNIVIVNPAAPVGPGDVKPTPTGKMVLDAANGRMPAYVNTGLNVVHVDDVAEGHALALERGVAGEAYILGSENLMLRELLVLIARQARRRPPLLRLPVTPLMPLAALLEKIASITGKPPLMTTEMLQMALKKMFFSSAKAVTALGYAPRPAAEAVADALDWFAQPGHAEMIAFLAMLTWAYLVFGHGRFWQSGPELAPATPVFTPDVDIIVPARDEAETIQAVISSLLAQDYAGSIRVILVDDNSTDGTAALAGEAPNLVIISGQPKPPGWSGKLWALQQGIEASSAPVLLFADADIVHDPRHLSALVARLETPRVDMVSEMVRLNCASLAERALVPAFVYFFQMLYPFAKVNDPLSGIAAAAGGTVLIRRDALARFGGIAAIKSALIDDVALAREIKKYGPIFLGHSGLATSIRPYPHFADIFRMVSRTAFTQLNHSALILAGTLAGLTLVWLVPAFEVLFGHGWRFIFGLAAWALAAASYMPTLERYRCAKTWALALPAIALFYMVATVSSALDRCRGTGASWKNRDYGAAL